MNYINFDLFEKIEATSSKNEKVELLRQMGENEKTLVRLALDPDKVYHLTRIDYPPEHETSWTNIGLIELCEYLASKKALTNDDRWLVGNFLWQTRDTNGELAFKWFERVILKDLKAGFDVSSANKAHPGLIPTNDIALCNVFDFEKHLTGNICAKYFYDAKADGVRCTATVSNGKVTMVSRSGKVFHNFPQIEKELAKLPDFQFDGEIYMDGKDGFQKLMKYVGAEENAPDNIPFRFIMFDIICAGTAVERRSKLENILVSAFGIINPFDKFRFHVGERLGCLYVCDFPINCTEEKLNLLLEEAEEFGYEGLVLKEKMAEYTPKKTNKFLKLKNFYSAEFTVIGIYEGKDKNEGQLGGFNMLATTDVEIKNKKGKLIGVVPKGTEFCCGGGFSDEMRWEFWKNPPIGRIAEIKMQDLTKDKKPRFNVFKRFRSDLEQGL
jgi:DNA ligase-1